MHISQAQALLINELRERMAALVADASIARKAENLRDVCRLLQAVGISKLINEADVKAFREYLIRSGQARRYYLRISREEANTDDRFLGLSRVDSIFDAMVASDVPLARDIAALSIDQWHRDWEYEDDFCYYLFLQRLIAAPAFLQTSDAIALLSQFAKALEGQPSPRLSLCRALRERNIDDFRTALEGLLQQHADVHDEKRAGITEYSSQAIFWPRSFVSIEALAWLFIGARFGLKFDDQFQFCPDSARAAFEPLVVEDLFQSLDEALKSA